MEHVTHEITREYRLDFEGGEAGWDDPIPPEVTSRVLGREATCTINRTSLLAWSLLNIAHVQVADLACGGWIKIVISTGPDFDESAFRAEVAGVLDGVKSVRSNRRPRAAERGARIGLEAVVGAVAPLAMAMPARL